MYDEINKLINLTLSTTPNSFQFWALSDWPFPAWHCCQSWGTLRYVSEGMLLEWMVGRQYRTLVPVKMVFWMLPVKKILLLLLSSIVLTDIPSELILGLLLYFPQVLLSNKFSYLSLIRRSVRYMILFICYTKTWTRRNYDERPEEKSRRRNFVASFQFFKHARYSQAYHLRLKKSL